LNTVVLAVLSLVVLVLLIMLIRTQLQKGSQKYTNISAEAEREARAKDVCETLFALRSRTCVESETKCKEIGTDYRPVSGAWSDCNRKFGKTTTICCEGP